MSKSIEITEYIAQSPKSAQSSLKEIRKLVHQSFPEVDECISYQIPCFKIGKKRFYFAAFKNHFSVFPAPRGIDEFKEILSKYKGGKGTVQFPFESNIDFELIQRIIYYCLS